MKNQKSLILFKIEKIVFQQTPLPQDSAPESKNSHMYSCTPRMITSSVVTKDGYQSVLLLTVLILT